MALLGLCRLYLKPFALVGLPAPVNHEEVSGNDPQGLPCPRLLTVSIERAGVGGCTQSLGSSRLISKGGWESNAVISWTVDFGRRPCEPKICLSN